MIPAQRHNDIRTLTATATRHRVTLPKHITDQARHLDVLEQEQRNRAPLTPTQCATELAAHLGNPAAMSKARTKAAADMAARAADEAVTTHLIDHCATLLHQRIRKAADDIATAFAPAVAGALDTLTRTAAALPAAFKADNAADLNAADYTAWTEARDAHALIESLHAALRILYTTPADDLLTPEAVRALRYVQPPTFSNSAEASTFARALAGIRHGGSSIGPVNIDGVFTPPAVAHLGGTFAWATPTEVQARAEALHVAATPTVVDRSSHDLDRFVRVI